MVFNSWHDVEIGENAPHEINMIVEIPKESRVKYELDKETGLMMRDRVLWSAVHYPGDYGFVPQTLWDDGDPLDVVVITYEPTFPGTLCSVKVIGVLRMIDDGERDDKIIAVHANDPRCAEWDDIEHIPQHLLKEIKEFFATYKRLQGKEVQVFDVFGAEEAKKDVKRSQEMYAQKFGTK
ncbi:inorganic diphosphatase [Candidatus Woesearchaeota archaeon]|nr:MAG: inorganic diphosphatase [Candidatus Woesearchaeota archaeon]